ncbi:MAG: RsmB/NOP family class I SAM-dependent RNA methyltransferase [Acidimicrobiia bacterium]
MSKEGVASRLGAAAVVGRVMREGAWTSLAVQAGAKELSAEDARTLEGLVYGTIRHLASLDAAIRQYSACSAIDDEVLDQLRVGTFEIWHGHAPTPVAVDTAVESIRSIRPRSAGFVNAVLRKISSTPPPTDRSSRLCLPTWLIESLDSAWGAQEVDDFGEASLQPAPVSVRLRPGQDPPRGSKPISQIAGAYELEGRFQQGAIPLADPSSVAVVAALGVEGGQRVADLAAAPGGKTMDIVDRLGGDGFVVASDRQQRRALRAAKRVPEASWTIADGRAPALRRERFDRVLVDAPCSGLGTIRRRPEIRHRATPAEIMRLATLQQQMLAAALELVADGGRLVYSVCTVTPEETIDQVRDLGAKPPRQLPGRRWGDGWLLAPHLTGTDGMFIAVFDR